MGTELRLLTDYLTNRKQYVRFNNHNSDTTNNSTGVPQGSMLGPLICTIYINDLIHTSDRCIFNMYADDTTIYFNLEDFDPETLNNEINSELVKISIWLTRCTRGDASSFFLYLQNVFVCIKRNIL